MANVKNCKKIKRTDRVIDWLLIFLYNIRHGKDHRFNPTEVNYRANIDAMRQLGVTHILSATACGSLKVSLYGHANKYKAYSYYFTTLICYSNCLNVHISIKGGITTRAFRHSGFIYRSYHKKSINIT